MWYPDSTDQSTGWHILWISQFSNSLRNRIITRNHMQRRLYHITVLALKIPLEKHLLRYINHFDNSSPKSRDTLKWKQPIQETLQTLISGIATMISVKPLLPTSWPNFPPLFQYKISSENLGLPLNKSSIEKAGTESSDILNTWYTLVDKCTKESVSIDFHNVFNLITGYNLTLFFRTIETLQF